MSELVPRRGRTFRQGHRLESVALGGPVDHPGALATAPRQGPALRCRRIASWKGRASHSPCRSVLETAPVEAASSASSWGSANAGGGSPAVRFMGQGDKAARTITSAAVLVPLQRIFGCSRYSSPPGCGANRRGRKRVCHAHVHHHWPPREVQEEVTALGAALGPRREPCRTGGAARVSAGRSTGSCRGDWARGLELWRRCGNYCRAGRSSAIGHSGSGCR